MSKPRNVTFGNYTISRPGGLEIQVCYPEEFNKYDSPWQRQNPMMRAVPLLATELGFAIITIRLFIILLKPLHQPRFIPELLVRAPPQPFNMPSYIFIHVWSRLVNWVLSFFLFFFLFVNFVHCVVYTYVD